MKKIILNTDIGATAAEHCSRYGIDHVAIVPDGAGGRAWAVATDGRALAMTHDVAVEGITEVVGVPKVVAEDASEDFGSIEIRGDLALSACRYGQAGPVAFPPLADLIERRIADLEGDTTIAVSLNASLLHDLARSVSSHDQCTLVVSAAKPSAKPIIVIGSSDGGIGLLMPLEARFSDAQEEAKKRLTAALAVARQVPVKGASTGTAETKEAQP